MPPCADFFIELSAARNRPHETLAMTAWQQLRAARNRPRKTLAMTAWQQLRAARINFL